MIIATGCYKLGIFYDYSLISLSADGAYALHVGLVDEGLQGMSLTSYHLYHI